MILRCGYFQAFKHNFKHSDPVEIGTALKVGLCHLQHRGNVSPCLKQTLCFAFHGTAGIYGTMSGTSVKIHACKLPSFGNVKHGRKLCYGL